MLSVPFSEAEAFPHTNSPYSNLSKTYSSRENEKHAEMRLTLKEFISWSGRTNVPHLRVSGATKARMEWKEFIVNHLGKGNTWHHSIEVWVASLKFSVIQYICDMHAWTHFMDDLRISSRLLGCRFQSSKCIGSSHVLCLMHSILFTCYIVFSLLSVGPECLLCKFFFSSDFFLDAFL